ncbi:putative exportin 1 [Cryptosporidium canis]|uniref:Exportin 1 n=1 Tax=Cryptosporidium canis TaxID=195482 RepID=A0A9D5DM34_9CRYT|nr:putative exportin 1 [Cryptosporidium canis]
MDISVLLDLSQPYTPQKVEMLDELVGIMYGLRPGDRVIADKVLSELKQKTESWRVVGNILQLSSDYNTKFFALSILEKCIQFQWKILPFDQKTGIKQYITEMCIELCQNEKILEENKHFLNKTNETLIMIVKQEWPDNWENFITEICNAAKTNQYICENTMKLLRLLSEEVFDFGEDQMVSKKVEKLMGILNQQFPQILSLIMFVLTSYLENPQNIKVNLVVSSLQCLCHYLKWIPLNYILECDLRPQLPHSITSNGSSNITYNLLQFLLDHFWGNPSFRLESIRCLTEISPLKIEENVRDINGNMNKKFEDQMVQIWLSIVNRIKEVPNEYAQYDTIPNISTSMRLYYERYFNYIALLLSSFIKTHRLTICEKYPETIQGMDFALERMVNISYIQNDEIFKVCVDFWLHFTQQLVYDVLDNSKKKPNENSMANHQANSSPLFLLKNDSFSNIDNPESQRQENPFNNPEEYSSRLVHYQSLLCDVRKMIICRMAKPQEVYIAIDPETGEVTRENIPDTDEISLYKSLREILIYLSNLGQNYMEKIILQLLQEEFDIVCLNCGVICTCNSSFGNQWNPIKLNRLCWAVGSISGSLSKNIERRLIIEVIKSLLMLCERKRGKANKAAVASCVMYVVGQYPRFLKDHWKFLQTVINKLFEFMHETFPGVKDMACEAFLKIATKCRKSMSSNNYIDGNNRNPANNQMLSGIMDGNLQDVKFLKYMIGYSHELKQHLDDKQILTLIQGISITISSLKDIDEQYFYITELLHIFDSLYWNDLVSKLVEFRSNRDNKLVINELCSMECSQKLIVILRIMETIASSSGVGFARVLIERSPFLIEFYKLYSSYIAEEVQQKGVIIVSHAHIKQLRISKKEIIKLINSFISFVAPRKKLKLNENKNFSGYITDMQSILYHNITGSEMMQYIIHPIIIPVLEDYHACISEVKESQVLILSSTVIVRLNDIVRVNNEIFNAIIYHTFECTLSMIKDNFHAYPDHREFFYTFLSDCNEFCFLQLFNLPGNILTLYVESIIWAIRHEQPNMAEKGLIILYNMLINLISHNSSKDIGVQNSYIQNNTLSQFCHAFYLSIIREIFGVLTDTLHTSGFQYQTMVLYELIKISEFSLFEGNQSNKPPGINSNPSVRCDSCQGGVCKLAKVGVMEYIADLLIKSFITVQKEQVEVFVLELFNSVHNKTITDFQRIVHDFLIQIKEFTNEESKHVFEIEKSIAIKRAIEIENSRQWAIPGLVCQEIGFNSISGEGDEDDIGEDDDE